MAPPDAETMICLECERTLHEHEDLETTDKGVLCRSCYERLAAQVRMLVDQQGQGINYPMAVIGALIGGIVGALVWWGFTVITKFEFGLVAVVIGFTVAKGILLLTGGKRSQRLQFLAVGTSVVAYFYANYLVSRTWILKEYPQMADRLGLVPDLSLFVEITRLSFSMFTAIFLAIVAWQAWQLVAPAKIE